MKMHIGMNVTDIQKTVGFYTKFFGLAPTKVKSDYAKYIVEEAGLVISFVQNPEKVAPEFGHYGFLVNDEKALTAKLESAQAQNLEILMEGETVCCYALQNKFWVTDPDGYRWETYTFLADAEKMKEGEKSCSTAVPEKSACCAPVSEEASCCA